MMASLEPMVNEESNSDRSLEDDSKIIHELRDAIQSLKKNVDPDSRVRPLFKKSRSDMPQFEHHLQFSTLRVKETENDVLPEEMSQMSKALDSNDNDI